MLAVPSPHAANPLAAVTTLIAAKTHTALAALSEATAADRDLNEGRSTSMSSSNQRSETQAASSHGIAQPYAAVDDTHRIINQTQMGMLNMKGVPTPIATNGLVHGMLKYSMPHDKAAPLLQELIDTVIDEGPSSFNIDPSLM
jgi:hypothetical protein